MSNKIGENIRHCREEKQLSQTQLAKIINVSQRMISYYESGGRIPPADVLKKLSSYFNVSTDYLLGNTDARAPYTADRGRSEPPEPLLTEKERNLLHAFRKLDSDDQDIVIGEAKKMVRENQRGQNADPIPEKGELKQAK